MDLITPFDLLLFSSILPEARTAACISAATASLTTQSHVLTPFQYFSGFTERPCGLRETIRALSY